MKRQRAAVCVSITFPTNGHNIEHNDKAVICCCIAFSSCNNAFMQSTVYPQYRLMDYR
jgi:hypothetical protein